MGGSDSFCSGCLVAQVTLNRYSVFSVLTWGLSLDIDLDCFKCAFLIFNIFLPGLRKLLSRCNLVRCLHNFSIDEGSQIYKVHLTNNKNYMSQRAPHTQRKFEEMTTLQFTTP
jgi:hypothetical protein